MRFRIVRVNLLVGVQLLEPYLLLAKRLPDVFDAFYKALSPRHRIFLTDMQSVGGNSFGDLKLTINVFNGHGRIEVTPTGLITDLRNLVQTDEDLKVIRDYLVTCEQALVASIGTDEKASTELQQRDFRANLWIDCEEGREAAEAWLRTRGEKALELQTATYPDMLPEFTLQIHLQDKNGRVRMGVGIQRSQVEIGHLYLACEHQLYRKDAALGPMDANFDRAYADLEGLLRSLGLEPARDNV
jgi:hypothetical protein